MGRLVFLALGMVLAAPFWLQFIFAGGAAYLGYTQQEKHAAWIAHRAELLQAAPPQTIDIGTFDKKYSSANPTEVSVTAQVATDHNTRLIRRTNFIKTDESVLYVLVDANAPANETVARGAIVIDPDQIDTLVDWLASNATGFGDNGPVVKIDGLLDSGTDTSMVSKAFKDQGMTKGPNFFYIEPFFEGREAGLAVKPDEARSAAMPLYYIALFFVLVGCFKAFTARRKARKGPVPTVRSLGESIDGDLPAQTFAADPAPPRAALTPTGAQRGGIAEYHVPGQDGQSLDVAMRARIEAAMANPKAAFKAPEGDAALAANLIAPLEKPAPKTVLEQIAALSKMKLGFLAVIGLVAVQQLAPKLLMTILPFAFLGLFYFLFYKGSAKLRSTVGSVLDGVTDKFATDKAAPSSAEPASGAKASFASVTSKARDKFASSPIQSGGFSFSDLMPQRKLKPMPGPDPFDRLAERVRAERLKQSQG